MGPVKADPGHLKPELRLITRQSAPALSLRLKSRHSLETFFRKT
jgi:hypothetical protein